MEGLKESIRALGEHNTKIAKMEKEKALDRLRKEKREARREGDDDLVDEIDSKIDEVKEMEIPEIDEPKPSGPSDEEVEAINTWMKENTWYQQDLTLTSLADRMFETLNEKKSSVPMKERLEEIKITLENDFPEKFGKTRTVNKVAGKGNAGNGGKGKSKFSIRDLDEEQRKFAKAFVESGAFEKEQDYVDQLAELGEIIFRS
jgi:hypothetical protein